jgi:hypothetical protein
MKASGAAAARGGDARFCAVLAHALLVSAACLHSSSAGRLTTGRPHAQRCGLSAEDSGPSRETPSHLTSLTPLIPPPSPPSPPQTHRRHAPVGQRGGQGVPAPRPAQALPPQHDGADDGDGGQGLGGQLLAGERGSRGGWAAAGRCFMHGIRARGIAKMLFFCVFGGRRAIESADACRGPWLGWQVCCPPLPGVIPLCRKRSLSNCLWLTPASPPLTTTPTADLVPAGPAGAGGAARASHLHRQDAALLRAVRRGGPRRRLCGRPLPHG